MMKEAGADINTIAQVNHRYDSRGGTALHYAARKRWREMIKTLASYGINMNAKDQDGLTALDYTQGRGYMGFMDAANSGIHGRGDTPARVGRDRDAFEKSRLADPGPPSRYRRGHLAAR